MKTLPLILLLGWLALQSAAAQLKVWVSYVDSASFAPNNVATLMLTGTDSDGYVLQRRTMPGPWTDFITIDPELGLGRMVYFSDMCCPPWTIYPGPGYIFPIEFFDNATAPQYRAKKL